MWHTAGVILMVGLGLGLGLGLAWHTARVVLVADAAAVRFTQLRLRPP